MGPATDAVDAAQGAMCRQRVKRDIAIGVTDGAEQLQDVPFGRHLARYYWLA